jgi:hypothetical protein
MTAAEVQECTGAGGLAFFMGELQMNPKKVVSSK